MANEALTVVQQKYLTDVVDYVNSKGDKQVYKYFFTKSRNKGCGGHPELSEHGEIAQELTVFLKLTLNW
ncbi:hypothetical protein [Xanthocytophaga agilis]|nr:hypothetical protein [Xanthocytophaga agilis]